MSLRNAYRIEKQGAIVARNVVDPEFYIYILNIARNVAFNNINI